MEAMPTPSSSLKKNSNDTINTDNPNNTDNNSNNTDNNNNNNNNRRIRFADKHIYHLIPHLDAFSKQDIKATWFTRKEYDAIFDHCEITAQVLEEYGYVAGSELCVNGLEHWTSNGTRKRERNRNTAFDAVMNEQDAQWADGADDHDALAELYGMVTKNSRMVASTLAYQLEREVGYAYGNAEEQGKLRRGEIVVSAISKKKKKRSSSKDRSKKSSKKKSKKKKSSKSDRRSGSTGSCQTDDSEDSFKPIKATSINTMTSSSPPPQVAAKAKSMSELNPHDSFGEDAFVPLASTIADNEWDVGKRRSHKPLRDQSFPTTDQLPAASSITVQDIKQYASSGDSSGSLLKSKTVNNANRLHKGGDTASQHSRFSTSSHHSSRRASPSGRTVRQRGASSKLLQALSATAVDMKQPPFNSERDHARDPPAQSFSSEEDNTIVTTETDGTMKSTMSFDSAHVSTKQRGALQDTTNKLPKKPKLRRTKSGGSTSSKASRSSGKSRSSTRSKSSSKSKKKKKKKKRSVDASPISSESSSTVSSNTLNQMRQTTTYADQALAALEEQSAMCVMSQHLDTDGEDDSTIENKADSARFDEKENSVNEVVTTTAGEDTSQESSLISRRKTSKRSKSSSRSLSSASRSSDGKKSKKKSSSASVGSSESRRKKKRASKSSSSSESSVERKSKSSSSSSSSSDKKSKKKSRSTASSCSSLPDMRKSKKKSSSKSKGSKRKSLRATKSFEVPKSPAISAEDDDEDDDIITIEQDSSTEGAVRGHSTTSRGIVSSSSTTTTTASTNQQERQSHKSRSRSSERSRKEKKPKKNLSNDSAASNTTATTNSSGEESEEVTSPSIEKKRPRTTKTGKSLSFLSVCNE